jgi:uncharacterized membrane protein YccF (DUF307 family)
MQPHDSNIVAFNLANLKLHLVMQYILILVFLLICISPMGETAFSLAIFLLFPQSDNISLRDLRSDLHG